MLGRRLEGGISLQAEAGERLRRVGAIAERLFAEALHDRVDLLGNVGGEAERKLDALDIRRWDDELTEFGFDRDRVILKRRRHHLAISANDLAASPQCRGRRIGERAAEGEEEEEE